MFLAKVIGQVVATKKEDSMVGRKLLLLRPMLVSNDTPATLVAGQNTVVAVDTVGSGEGEMVLFCQGSSARQAAGLKALPVDAAVVGIVDAVRVDKQSLYHKKD